MSLDVTATAYNSTHAQTDSSPRRWTRHIDIYMQEDVRAARQWGRRRVQISWTPAPS